MRAYELRGNGVETLALVERPRPHPGLGQVLVRIRATSLNYRDLMVASGTYTRGGAQRPLVPLSDGAGEVIEVGPGVTRLRPGDRVAGSFFQRWIDGPPDETKRASALGGGIDGVLAEEVVLQADAAVRLPEHLTFEEAATLPCAALTAWHALESGAPACGQSVLTLGTGGVSTFALQFARAAGARVIATTGSAAKEKKLAALGASDVVNYAAVPEWEKTVWELTDRRGVDLVVEVGGAGTMGKSLKAVRTGGQTSLIGVLAGATGEVNPLPAVMKGVRIQGIYVGSREQFVAMNRAIELHGIRPVIDRVFPFAEAQAACRYLESGAHFGKVVIAM